MAKYGYFTVNSGLAYVPAKHGKSKETEAIEETVRAFKITFRPHCVHKDIIDDNGVAACKFCGSYFVAPESYSKDS